MTDVVMDREFLSGVLDAILIPVFVKNEWHQWIVVNQAFCDLVGQPRQKLCGKSDDDVFLQEQAETFWAIEHEVLRSGIVHKHQFCFINTHGKTHHLSVIRSRFQVETGEYYLVGVMQDLNANQRINAVANQEATNRALLETMPDLLSQAQRDGQQLRCSLTKSTNQELNELKARFLSVVSHEFRTPLTTIQTSIDLLQSFDMTEAERTELFNQIHGAVAQTTQIMESVVLVGQAEAGQLSLKPSWFDLQAMCQRVVRMAELTTGRSIELTIARAAGCDRVYLDDKLMHHILNNLLSNALKYSAASSVVQIRLTQTANAVTIQVHDDGVGIPAEEQPYLFDFFYRASNVGATSGTGVGLAIVKHCVELHNGQITVESEVNQGTTFTICLPMGE